MRTVWDTGKARSNAAKHGVEFRDAQAVFDGPFLQIPDVRRDYGEARFLVIGRVDGTCLAVVYAQRGAHRRLISARPASREERERYENATAGL
jgi:uncharacterized DUF497 family protein